MQPLSRSPLFLIIVHRLSCLSFSCSFDSLALIALLCLHVAFCTDSLDILNLPRGGRHRPAAGDGAQCCSPTGWLRRGADGRLRVHPRRLPRESQIHAYLLRHLRYENEADSSIRRVYALHFLERVWSPTGDVSHQLGLSHHPREPLPQLDRLGRRHRADGYLLRFLLLLREGANERTEDVAADLNRLQLRACSNCDRFPSGSDINSSISCNSAPSSHAPPSLTSAAAYALARARILKLRAIQKETISNLKPIIGRTSSPSATVLTVTTSASSPTSAQHPTTSTPLMHTPEEIERKIAGVEQSILFLQPKIDAAEKRRDARVRGGTLGGPRAQAAVAGSLRWPDRRSSAASLLDRSHPLITSTRAPTTPTSWSREKTALQGHQASRNPMRKGGYRRRRRKEGRRKDGTGVVVCCSCWCKVIASTTSGSDLEKDRESFHRHR